MVTTTFNTFCSLTVQCARCHDHKFDPVKQEHYYSLQAVFAALDRADRPYDVGPTVAHRRHALETRRREMQALLRTNPVVASSELSRIGAELVKLPSPRLVYCGSATREAARFGEPAPRADGRANPRSPAGGRAESRSPRRAGDGPVHRGRRLAVQPTPRSNRGAALYPFRSVGGLASRGEVEPPSDALDERDRPRPDEGTGIPPRPPAGERGFARPSALGAGSRTRVASRVDGAAVHEAGRRQFYQLGSDARQFAGGDNGVRPQQRLHFASTVLQGVAPVGDIGPTS